ncbi:sec-independent translocase [Actinomadura keratinilytica]
MFNDIGLLEVLTIVVLAVLIFGPDKLPKVIQDVAGFIRKIRDFSDSAKRDIREELGPEFKDFEFEDLNPKTFIRKQLENDDLGLKDIRDSFDLRKEMGDVADAVNGREEAESVAGPAADGPVDLTKRPEKSAPVAAASARPSTSTPPDRLASGPTRRPCGPFNPVSPERDGYSPCVVVRTEDARGGGPLRTGESEEGPQDGDHG